MIAQPTLHVWRKQPSPPDFTTTFSWAGGGWDAWGDGREGRNSAWRCLLSEASRISPQCLHFFALARICSPQYGQSFVSGSGGVSVSGWGAGLGNSIEPLQEGHSTVWPNMSSEISSDCSQWGQLNSTSLMLYPVSSARRTLKVRHGANTSIGEMRNSSSAVQRLDRCVQSSC